MKKYFLFTLSIFYFCTLLAQIDRSIIPLSGPTPSFQLKTPHEFILSNGLRLFVIEDHKLPRVAMVLFIDNQPQFQGNLKGLNRLLSSMMGNGSRNISKDDFNEEVDFLGGQLSFGSSSASAFSLTKSSPRMMELMAEALLSPNFTESDFLGEKLRLNQTIKRNDKTVKAIAKRVKNVILYGIKHPSGEYPTPETISNIEFDDLNQRYLENFNPHKGYLFVIGDVDTKQIKDQVNQLFGSWKSKTQRQPTLIEPVKPSPLTLYLTDVPDNAQAELSVVFNTSVNKKSPDFFALILANRILGGGPQARLFLNLREDKAYTYGAYSSFNTYKYAPAQFEATASVRNNVVDQAAIEMIKEIALMQNAPVSAAELAQAKALYVGEFIRSLEQPITVAQFAFDIKYQQLREDFYSSYLKKINAVRIEDIQRVAQRYFKLENAGIFITGNAAEIRPKLKDFAPLGKRVPIKELDQYGNELP